MNISTLFVWTHFHFIWRDPGVELLGHVGTPHLIPRNGRLPHPVAAALHVTSSVYEHAICPGPHQRLLRLSSSFQLPWCCEVVLMCISLPTDVVWVRISLCLSSFRSLLRFLDMWIIVFHQIWEVFSHHFFQYSSSSLSLLPLEFWLYGYIPHGTVPRIPESLFNFIQSIFYLLRLGKFG